LDWQLAAGAMHRRFGERFSILDVGCFDGAFLRSLHGDLDRFGVEILPEAAQRAEAEGVRILSADFARLADEPTRYDVVTAFDVIEHVENPHLLMSLLSQVLKPQGLLILSTGDLDSRTWQLMRHRYWYCAIPEHISYLSVHWFDQAAADLQLRLIDVQRFAHAALPLGRRVLEAAANLVFLAAPGAVGRLRRLGVGSASASLHRDAVDAYPPGWLSARDHILVTFEKI
jgi:SAM-dependent methyltransferase